MQNKTLEFNKLKRKLDLLTVEHRILTGYLSLVEDALIQEVRQYIHPKYHSSHGRKRHCYRPRSPSSSSSPPLSPSFSSSTSSSPILTPVHEKLDISFIVHST